MKKLSPQQIEAILQRENVSFEAKSIQGGQQFVFQDDAKLNAYSTKKRHWCGDLDGETKVTVESLLDGSPTPLVSLESEGDNANGHSASNKVFIVCGHDTAARNDLELMLRRFKLEPIILQNQTSGGQTIIEKLDHWVSEAPYAIVLLTPDDHGVSAASRDDSKAWQPRARQNVVLELGMFLSKLGRRRVAILYREGVECPSDIDGLVYIGFKNNISEITTRLAGELQEAGFGIHIKDLIAS